MSLELIKFFANYIEKETGIIYSDTNVYQLQSRLEEICKHFNLASLTELHQEFAKVIPNPAYKQKLLDHATNNETLFFRDVAFFSALENYLLREVLLDMPDEIRIWSAASSTGQEALSVAMTLEEMSARVPLPPYSIIATDISEKALNKARSGFYNDFEVMRGLSDERKHRFFNREKDGWQVKSHLLSKIKFNYNNLIRPTVGGEFHIVLCRNVLIYQKVEVKKTIADYLLRQLAPTGALLLGVGETLLGINNDVDMVLTGNVIFYRPKNKGRAGAA